MYMLLWTKNILLRIYGVERLGLNRYRLITGQLTDLDRCSDDHNRNITTVIYQVRTLITSSLYFMSKIKYIRDGNGKIIAQERGNLIQSNGKVIAQFNPGTNITTDVSGKVRGRGDQRLTVLGEDKDKKKKWMGLDVFRISDIVIETWLRNKKRWVKLRFGLSRMLWLNVLKKVYKFRHVKDDRQLQIEPARLYKNLSRSGAVW